MVGVITTATKHYNSAIRLAEEGMVDHALIEAEAAVELWDKNAHFHNLLGTLYAKKGLLDKAVAEWKKTLSLDPTMAKAANNIEKARKLELLQADRASKRPYYIAIGVLAVLALVFLAWGGYTQQRMGRLSNRLTLLEQDSADFQGLKDIHSQTLAELEAAWSIIEASAAVEMGLRKKVEEQEAELSRTADQLRAEEQQVADQSAELNALRKRVADLEKQVASPPVITPADLKALRDQNAGLKAKVAELENVATDREGELNQTRDRLDQLVKQVEQQASHLHNAERELTRTTDALAHAEMRGASLEERLAALKSELRRWDLRDAEIAQILRLTRGKRHSEASGRLGEVRQDYGSNPLLDALAIAVEEDTRLAEDPFEREVQRRFAEERRDNELRLREEFADAHFDAAQRLFREGMYYKALTELETAERINPGHRGVEDLRQRILGEQKKSETKVSDLIEEADEAMASGNDEKALGLLRQALKEFPEHPVALERLARLQDKEKALEMAERSQAEQYRADVADVEALLRESRLAEALRLVHLLERKYPEDPKLARLRSTTEERINERIARIPGEVERAKELFIARKYGEVVELMEDVLRWQPGNARARLYYEEAAERLEILQTAFAAAEGLYLEGRYEEARSAVERILDAQPDHRDAKRLESDIAAALKNR